MLKNKLDYKLINLALIFLIVFFVYNTGNLWIGILSKTVQIMLPFLFAFAFAYAMYPFLKKIEDKKIPKAIGVAIIVFLIFLFIFFVIYLITAVMIEQLSSIFQSIISFISSISNADFDFNLVGLESSLSETFRSILTNVGKYVSDGAINLIDTSLSLISKLFIIIASFIYFLIDMDKIRDEIKFFFKKRNKKMYNFIKRLDLEMKNYLSGLIQIIIITLIEYTLAYTIIGHPNAILLGFLAAVANLIPYFGGIGVNVIAFITAFAFGSSLLFKTIIVFIILSAIDSYVINPTIYGKTNSIHPLVTIIALFAGGIIFGITGVFISFPLAIVIATMYKYFKDDLLKNIKKVKIKD